MVSLCFCMVLFAPHFPREAKKTGKRNTTNTANTSVIVESSWSHPEALPVAENSSTPGRSGLDLGGWVQFESLDFGSHILWI